MTIMPPIRGLSGVKQVLTEHLAEAAGDGEVIFTTSLSREDQVLTWAIVESGLPIDIVTLDTGKLFPETLELLDLTERMLDIRIGRVHPDPDLVAAFETTPGMQAIYEGVDARKQCCHIRKVAPLKQACAGKKWWVTGLRQGQSQHRASLSMVEPMPEWDLKKLHPLLEWSDEDLDNALPELGIPVNPLHAQGYPSIGCSPCTRAVSPGEHPRSGRWWWEQSSKECGLHRG